MSGFQGDVALANEKTEENEGILKKEEKLSGQTVVLKRNGCVRYQTYGQCGPQLGKFYFGTMFNIWYSKLMFVVTLSKLRWNKTDDVEVNHITLCNIL